MVHSWHEEAKIKWDASAKRWAANSREMWDEGSRQTIIPFFVEHIPTGKVIDLGCGDGYGSLKLARAGFKVVGLDLSEEMITEAAEKTQNQDNLSFIQGDLTVLPFESEEMDSIMAINSIEWTERPLDALNEIKRILKPGGYGCFAILGPTAGPRANSYPRLYNKKVIMNNMQAWEFRQLAEENGWELIAETGVPKQGVDYSKLAHLSKDLKQALSFMWLFILKKAETPIQAKSSIE